MSIISLKSDNPDLSYIISKNPASGLIAKSMRKGNIFGFFTKGSEQAFNIYFKDGSDEVSFPAYEDEKFEYLNTTRYTSATFVVSAIDEMLRSAFKSSEYMTENGKKKDEGGVESQFFINMMYIKNDRYIDAFEDYFEDFKVNAELINGKNYQITITTKRPVFELLNFASLFAIFQAIVNKEPMFIADENVNKYIRCMNIIDAPYFLRYLFKIRFIENKRTFKSVQEELSKNRKADIEMKYGSTWQARQMDIEERLEFRNNILDVGCGEGRYITRFNQFMKGLEYFAVDIDDEERAKAEKRISHKRMKNVTFFKTVDQFLESDKCGDKKIDIICTEVIEHMSPEDAASLINEILNVPNIGSLIVTTPDVRFNDNYFMDGMRHDDHDFEWDDKEFTEFMHECLGPIKRSGDIIESIEWFGIGDVVNGVCPSQGIIVKFK